MSRQLPLNLRLKDSSSFENFLPAANREAVARLRAAVAALARDRALEPVLFLCGAPGTGRTHLLQAACREAQSVGGSALYIPFSEIASFAPAILEDLDQVSLVCLDDVERVAGNAVWETAVFALCERLRAAGGMLLAAGAPAARARFATARSRDASWLGAGVCAGAARRRRKTGSRSVAGAQPRAGNAGGGGALYSCALSARPGFAVRAARSPGSGLACRAASSHHSVLA